LVSATPYSGVIPAQGCTLFCLGKESELQISPYSFYVTLCLKKTKKKKEKWISLAASDKQEA